MAMNMTTTQLGQLTRAEQIAARDGLRALKGTNGRWAVLSRSQTAQAGYPVYHVLHVDGGRIRCTCEAATQGNRICAHAAAVRTAITVAREAERVAALRQAAAECERRAERRERAPLARPAAAFSLFK